MHVLVLISLNMLEHIVKAFLKALSPNNIQICVSHISRVEKLGKIVKYYVLSQKFSATLYEVIHVVVKRVIMCCYNMMHESGRSFMS